MLTLQVWSVVHMVQSAKHIGIWMTATMMLPSFVWALPDWQNTPPVTPPIPNLQIDTPTISPVSASADDGIEVIDEAALMADSDLFTQVLDSAVEQEAWQMVAELLPLYASLDHHDHTLYHFATARLSEQTDAAKAIDHYEQALAMANLTPIKIRLISAYLVSGRTLSAVELMQDVLADENLPKQIHDHLTAQYRQLNAPKLTINARYLADDNINQAPTRIQWGNWQLSPAESAHGIGYDVDVRKTIYPKDHYRITPAVRVLGKNYWDNSAYNDRIYELSTAVSHRQMGREITLLPYYQQRYFAGVAYGTRMGVRAQLNQRYADHSWQLGVGYAVKKHGDRQYLDGDSYDLTAMFAQGGAAHGVHLIGQLVQDNAQHPTDSYLGYSALIGSEHQVRQWGVSYQLGFGARHYQDRDIFGIWRRDRMYSLGGSLWHYKLSYRGYLPRLNYQFERRDSTHFAYDTRSSAVFVDVQKRF